jgi:hypothetical protein
MTAEATRPRPGSATIMGRLLDIVTVEAIRSFVENTSAADSGWLRALRDPQLARRCWPSTNSPKRTVADSMASTADVALDLRAASPRRWPCHQHYLTRLRMFSAPWTHCNASRSASPSSRIASGTGCLRSSLQRHIGSSPSRRVSSVEARHDEPPRDYPSASTAYACPSVIASTRCLSRP